jgi:tRNA (guanine10-N2)-dimethyltransferase
MLPPKLAQTIINLAAGSVPEQTLQNICDIPAGEPIPRVMLNQTVLDPFCGTGVVLQEAVLMGYDAYGTDLEQRMVEYSEANLEWLRKSYDFDAKLKLEAGDATNYKWSTEQKVDIVACESYLGRPFTQRPSPEILNQTASECNLIIKKFLKNIHGQLNPGARLCIAVPAWQTSRGQFKHLSLLDSLEEIGYNHIRFEHVRDTQLLYYREDQVVARELLVITRK